MKLPDHVDIVRDKIHKAFNNQFARLGFSASKLVEIDKIPVELHAKRNKIEQLIISHESETGIYSEAREKALDELTFTLFNRLAAIKVMEALQLFPPIITKQAEHGGRSLGHKVWLEQNPMMRNEELEGLREYFKFEFNKLGEDIPLFQKNYPYAFIPFVIEFNEIIEAFNNIELDTQIEDNIWQSDDILGWLYESYNNVKKLAHKDSGDKTEYNKVSIQSQVYTPRWVVEFLVHNSLGKLYLEMYPDSEVKNLYQIANAPQKRVRDIKPLHELKLIDPASGSGNFLLYAFAFFYALYLDQIENYDADYEIKDIPKLIIENNLHGIDLDDRAAQLAQLGLWIKAKQKNRNTKALHFNVVSSDFYLPDYEAVKHIFESNDKLDIAQKKLIATIWTDLQQAYKFGSLVKIEEKIKHQVEALYNKKKRGELDLFLSAEITKYEEFEKDFFKNLEMAVSQYAEKQGTSFLTDKTKDAITFLKLITQKYDVATANPPYTDSADFGAELKKFIDANYAKPYKFNTNLYASFIKRCFELTNEKGKVAMVHPPTFMYIKTFEDVRKFILEKTHIDLFVEWGYLGMFHPSARVDAAMYVLEKEIQKEKDTPFIKLNHIYEGKRYDAFVESYAKLVDGINHFNNYSIPQSKLKIIKSFPFIYWISDEFREKFKSKALDDVIFIRQGGATGDNLRTLRLWWEIDFESLSLKLGDEKKWVIYQKGGPFLKWYGNNWCVIGYNDPSEYEYLSTHGNCLPSKDFYFKEGVSYCSSGSKGVSYRYMPENQIISGAGPGIYPSEEFTDVSYFLAFLNSKMSYYLTACLNPTVNTTQGDLKRIPFVTPKEKIRKEISELADINIALRKNICSFSWINVEFKKSPFNTSNESDLKKRIKVFFEFENFINAQVLLNEAIINEKIFEVYDLTDSDKEMVLVKEGVSIGELPVSKKAKEAYLQNELAEFKLENIRDFIQNLPEQELSSQELENIENEFPQLYQSNNDLEEFCIRHKVNPINVWYLFKESNVIPKQRMNDLAMEFLADLIREILMEDQDGIIPLVPNAGEKILLDRIEEKFIEKGFSMAQYSSFDSLLGKELNDYINRDFFKAFSDHLNLFMYLPKTPFIWHLTSGPDQGFDCYLIIYKWNRDKLLSLRSVYIEHRERALVNRQSDLANDSSAKAQNEKDKIYKQLKEIESFKAKIDELLAENYNPILDDGVGKNIAPLQKRGMLAYEVLNAGQLKKYLNANW